jgi:hypothetical protein
VPRLAHDLTARRPPNAPARQTCGRSPPAGSTRGESEVLATMEDVRTHLHDLKTQARIFFDGVHPDYARPQRLEEVASMAEARSLMLTEADARGGNTRARSRQGDERDV